MHVSAYYYICVRIRNSRRLTCDLAEMANDLTWVFRFTIEALVRIGGISGYMFYRRFRV